MSRELEINYSWKLIRQIFVAQQSLAPSIDPPGEPGH